MAAIWNSLKSTVSHHSIVMHVCPEIYCPIFNEKQKPCPLKKQSSSASLNKKKAETPPCMRVKQIGIAGSSEQRQRELVAVCGILSAILAVEHRAVQPHLAHIWQLLWLAAQGKHPHLQIAAILAKILMLLLLFWCQASCFCAMSPHWWCCLLCKAVCEVLRPCIDLAQGVLLTLVSADSWLVVALEEQLHASCYCLLAPSLDNRPSVCTDIALVL